MIRIAINRESATLVLQASKQKEVPEKFMPSLGICTTMLLLLLLLLLLLWGCSWRERCGRLFIVQGLGTYWPERMGDIFGWLAGWLAGWMALDNCFRGFFLTLPCIYRCVLKIYRWDVFGGREEWHFFSSPLLAFGGISLLGMYCIAVLHIFGL